MGISPHLSLPLIPLNSSWMASRAGLTWELAGEAESQALLQI